MRMIKQVCCEIKGNICEAREKICTAYKLREKDKPLYFLYHINCNITRSSLAYDL